MAGSKRTLCRLSETKRGMGIGVEEEESSSKLMLEGEKRTTTLRMKPGNDVNMSFPSGVCRWQRNGTACCHGQRVCCTIIESWFVIAWSWAPLPRLQANGGPCRAGGSVRGPFLGGRLLSSKQPTASGQTKGQRTRALQMAHCKVHTLRVALQACGVQARPVFQAPGTRPAESHA